MTGTCSYEAAIARTGNTAERAFLESRLQSLGLRPT
jgi:hypothetical protein